LLKQPEVKLEELFANKRIQLDVHPHTFDLDIASVEIAVKYSGYLRREASEIERVRKNEHRTIPQNFPFVRVPGLSREVVQRLEQIRPDTIAQALRIPGVTPAAVAVLSTYLRRIPPEPASEDSSA